jgi:hypothetical protein
LHPRLVALGAQRPAARLQHVDPPRDGVHKLEHVIEQREVHRIWPVVGAGERRENLGLLTPLGAAQPDRAALVGLRDHESLPIAIKGAVARGARSRPRRHAQRLVSASAGVEAPEVL